MMLSLGTAVFRECGQIEGMRTMKHLRIAILAALLAGLLSGCIQNDTVIQVRPDGSGFIRETVLYSNTMLDFMVSMAQMDRSGDEDDHAPNKEPDRDKGTPPKEAKKTRDDIISDMAKDADKQVKQFGGEVTFVESRPVRTETAAGYTALYSFKDINLIRVNQNPGDKVEGDKSRNNGGVKKEETLSFKFEKGSPSRLTVFSPELKGIGGEKSSADEKTKGIGDSTGKPPEKENLDMLKAMFQDMKLSISLSIVGTITRTNATYRERTTLTLMEIDFGKIIGDYELLKKMNEAKPKSVEETKVLLKGIPGFKLELNYPVVVEFQ
jgi:hypothetical protein